MRQAPLTATKIAAEVHQPAGMRIPAEHKVAFRPTIDNPTYPTMVFIC
jgi:hypothetical protein